jgi:hypothetical protein
MLDNLDFSDILFAEMRLCVKTRSVLMLRSSPEMPQHLLLALDHHERLLEEARRWRLQMAAKTLMPQRPRRWRRLRFRLGELLIYMGQRLKTDTVWG